MSKTCNITILGADGRMGQAVAAVLKTHEKARLLYALTASDSPALGKAVPEHDITYSDDFSAALNNSDVIIDFSAPAATLKAADVMSGTKCKAMVSGTTGLSDTQETNLKKASDLTLLRSGNFSLGVNLLEALVEQAAKALDESWDIEVLEMHHRHKVDAPSGTALMLGEAAARGRGAKLKDIAAYERNGKRRVGDIGFAALRGGDIIGAHQLRLINELEMITLSHDAFDRSVFAQGAVDAALWAAKQPAGYYNMRDMLGL